MTRKKTWMWWSSGKDSAWALQSLRSGAEYDVCALVTTVNASADRVAMHAVRTELLRAQAEALGIPLRLVEIPYPCPNGAYEAAAASLIQTAEREGVSHMAFGDLFLEDVRAYRETLLASSTIEPVFPLWGADTRELAMSMIEGGISAHLTCVDPRALDPTFVGRPYDKDLLSDLPESVDPCGERGEFHTFVSCAPGFSRALRIKAGEVVERDGFVFADILSAEHDTGKGRAESSSG